MCRHLDRTFRWALGSSISWRDMDSDYHGFCAESSAQQSCVECAVYVVACFTFHNGF